MIFRAISTLGQRCFDSRGLVGVRFDEHGAGVNISHAHAAVCRCLLHLFPFRRCLPKCIVVRRYLSPSDGSFPAVRPEDQCSLGRAIEWNEWTVERSRMSGSSEIAHPLALKLTSDSGCLARGAMVDWNPLNEIPHPSALAPGQMKKLMSQVTEHQPHRRRSSTSRSYRRILGLRSHEFGLESQMETRGVELVAQCLDCGA